MIDLPKGADLPAHRVVACGTLEQLERSFLALKLSITVLYDARTGTENPVIKVGVEADQAGNLDDVIRYRQRPPHTYQQVKYAVDDRTLVSTDYLTRPSRTGGPSILRKIAAAWRGLTAAGDPVELALVTNRAPDPADPLISARDARTRRLLPKADDGGPNSAHGKTRTAWAQAAELAEDELLELLAILDFDLARDRGHLLHETSLTMLLTGLRGDAAAIAAGADWVAEQVTAGHRVLDRTMIENAVESLSLTTGPARTVVSVATLKPDPLAAQARHSIDWSDRFDEPDAYTKRRPKPPATWQQLQADIEAIPSHLAGTSHVAITGSLRQATAFAVGPRCGWSPTPTSRSCNAARYGHPTRPIVHLSSRPSPRSPQGRSATSPSPSKSRHQSPPMSVSSSITATCPSAG